MEVQKGIYKPNQLRQMVDKVEVINTAKRLISLTYNYSSESLRDIIDDEFCNLPGGEEWNGK